MQVALSLGANLGNKIDTLNKAADNISALPKTWILRASSIYRSPPLLPANAPEGWYKLYDNAALTIETDLAPHDLLDQLKEIERKLGRKPSPAWAPRVIDIDIIAYGDIIIDDNRLTLPHPLATERAFVLAPLSEISPNLRLSGKSVLAWKRELLEQLPAWMKIVNATPDSFSGDGLLNGQESSRVPENPQANFIDLGAESTRPKANFVHPAEEWSRLAPFIEMQNLNSTFRPKVSIDTRNPETAIRALRAGVDVINDVSGVANPEMLSALVESNCDIVVMHNLGIPADPRTTLAEEDPISSVLDFLSRKIDTLETAGIAKSRVIVDPGIGFGKTPAQSWRLLQNVEEFFQLETRILYGHSRKSFLKTITTNEAEARDVHSLVVSNALSKKFVDVIRVHNIEIHQAAEEAQWRLNQRF